RPSRRRAPPPHARASQFPDVHVSGASTRWCPGAASSPILGVDLAAPLESLVDRVSVLLAHATEEPIERITDFARVMMVLFDARAALQQQLRRLVQRNAHLLRQPADLVRDARIEVSQG